MNKYNSVIYKNPNLKYDNKLIKYIISNYFNCNGKLLDVGCGNGKHMDIFKKYNIDVYGLDSREQNNKRIKICNVETDKFPYEDNTFDFIYSKSLFEHILRADNCISECYRVLKPNGKIIIMIPEWKSQMKHYWDDYTHLHAWTKKSLKDMMMINGFNNVNCEIFYQLPFVWNSDIAKIVPKIISILPDSLKWKNEHMRNGEDRKLIRFSKEKMLLGYGEK